MCLFTHSTKYNSITLESSLLTSNVQTDIHGILLTSVWFIRAANQNNEVETGKRCPEVQTKELILSVNSNSNNPFPLQGVFPFRVYIKLFLS